MIPEIATQKVEISSLSETCDILPLDWLMVSAVKNRLNYFSALI
jgi:hypothetical protein